MFLNKVRKYLNPRHSQSTIDSEGFKGGTRGAPIMPRDAVSRTANDERTGRHKWVKERHYRVGPARAASFQAPYITVIIIRLNSKFFSSIEET